MGYSLNLVASSSKPVNDAFICTLCKELFKDPVIIKCKNQHMFCKTCISDFRARNYSISCPLDQNHAFDNDDKSVPPNIVGLMNQVKVRCEFHVRGCSKVFTLDKIEEHQNDCKWNPTNEKNCKVCGSGAGSGHDCGSNLKKEVAKVKAELSKKESTIRTLNGKLQTAVSLQKKATLENAMASANETEKHDLGKQLQMKELKIQQLQADLAQFKKDSILKAVDTKLGDTGTDSENKFLQAEVKRNGLKIKRLEKALVNISGELETAAGTIKQLEEDLAKSNTELEKALAYKTETEAKLGELAGTKSDLRACMAEYHAKNEKIEQLERKLQEEKKKKGFTGPGRKRKSVIKIEPDSDSEHIDQEVQINQFKIQVKLELDDDENGKTINEEDGCEPQIVYDGPKRKSIEEVDLIEDGNGMAPNQPKRVKSELDVNDNASASGVVKIESEQSEGSCVPLGGETKTEA